MRLTSTMLVAVCMLFYGEVFAQTNVQTISCNLSVIYDQALESAQKLPVCVVLLENETANDTHFMRIPLEGCCDINLVDTNGVEVAKTKYGNKYNFWNDSEIWRWEKDHAYDGFSVVKMSGHSDYQFYPSISIPEVFDVKAVGQYLLTVRLRLVKGATRDGSGKVVQHFIEPLVALVKVQIRPGDISTNSSTNSP